MDLNKAMDLKNRFTYHQPKAGQAKKYTQIRAFAHEYATLLVNLCPQSPELIRAIDKLEEAVMLANASIARHGKDEVGTNLILDVTKDFDLDEIHDPDCSKKDCVVCELKKQEINKEAERIDSLAKQMAGKGSIITFDHPFMVHRSNTDTKAIEVPGGSVVLAKKKEQK